MAGIRKRRFFNIATVMSMMLATASIHSTRSVNADDPVCAAPMSCSQTQPVCCDQIFQDAANRLKGLYAGLSSDTCAAPATPDTVASTACGTTAGGCAATAGSGCGLFGSGGFLLNSKGEPVGLTDLFNDQCGNNCLKDAGWKLGGNLVQSYTANFNNSPNRYNGPVTWTDQANQYQLNQFWLYAEKATDTSKKDFDLGGRFDIEYGTSARLTTESGLETPHLNGPGTYGLALPQFYAEAAYKKLKIKLGHFISPVGYFTVDTTQNFFSTIPYTYQWGEPFTHTGAIATYQFTDNLVISSGFIRGWDNFSGGYNGHLGNMTSWSYTFKDKSNLTQVIFLTQEPNANAQFTQRFYESLVYTKPIDDNWTYVAQSDFGTQRNATFDGKQANWYGFNQYAYYKCNDYITWGANFEWWRDEEGYRVSGFLPGSAPSGITGNPNGVPLSQLAGGYNGNFFQSTVGPRWYPTGKPNFFIRPNLRYDWYSGGINNATQAFNTGGATTNSKPYAGNHDSQGLFVTDICILF